MYLIEICFGEYDDYSHVPVMIVSDIEEAVLICEAIECGDAEYMKYVHQAIGDINPVDIGTQYTKIPIVNL